MKRSGKALREKQAAVESGIMRTAECGKHQVINTIYECHVQTQDEADEAVSQKHDWSQKVDPHEFPLAKLDVGSEMAASVPNLLWVARGDITFHTNDRSVGFDHERD